MGKSLEITDQNFESEIKQFKGVSLVDFWAPWCGPCQAMSPRIEELAEKYADNLQVKITKLNIDENPKSSEEYDIMSIPNIKIFSKGEVFHEILGLVPNQTIEDLLEKALEELSQ